MCSCWFVIHDAPQTVMAYLYSSTNCCCKMHNMLFIFQCCNLLFCLLLLMLVCTIMFFFVEKKKSRLYLLNAVVWASVCWGGKCISYGKVSEINSSPEIWRRSGLWECGRNLATKWLELKNLVWILNKKVYWIIQ